MICTWSTAYLDAVVYHIPLLLIEGFDSVDVFDVRTQRINDAYDVLKKTGVLYHFSEVRDKKLDFKYVDDEYIENDIYKYDEPAAPRVVDFMRKQGHGGILL